MHRKNFHPLIRNGKFFAPLISTEKLIEVIKHAGNPYSETVVTPTREGGAGVTIFTRGKASNQVNSTFLNSTSFHLKASCDDDDDSFKFLHLFIRFSI